MSAKQPGRFKKKMYEILHDSGGKTGLIYMIDDYFISGLIILNVIVIMFESIEEMHSTVYDIMHIFDIFSVAVFSIEYAMRILIADMVHSDTTPLRARLRYIFSFLGLVDLFAILPFYLPFIVTLDLRFLRILRLLRLFRIFKLAHYSKSIRMVGTVLRKQKYELLVTVVGTFLILLVTSSLMYEIEHDVQPDKFPNIFATFWWAIATLTTIGYGDVYPVTGWGQFLAAVTALFGIGLVAIPTGILSMGFMEEIQKRAKEKKKAEKKKEELEPDSEHKFCPCCGQRLPASE